MKEAAVDNLSLDSQWAAVESASRLRFESRHSLADSQESKPAQPSRSDLLCGSARETATSAENGDQSLRRETECLSNTRHLDQRRRERKRERETETETETDRQRDRERQRERRGLWSAGEAGAERRMSRWRDSREHQKSLRSDRDNRPLVPSAERR
jgi:hypothetical protein